MSMDNYILQRTNISTVGFDFFETLIHRSCHPESVLISWARNLCVLLKLDMSSTELYYLRKKAENDLKKGLNIEEPSYYQLIEKTLEYICRANSVISVDKKEFVDIAYKLEKKIENQHLSVDQDIINRIYIEKAKGNSIILISDFYMPLEFIAEVLVRNNIIHLFDEVYVSSEYGVRKSTGNLYKFVLFDRNIKPEELLMIGDNQKSDYEIPCSLGIKAEWRPYQNISPFYKCKIKRAVNEILTLHQENDVFKGYLSALIIFVDRLYKAALNDGCEILLFCSREGQNLKKLFDIHQSILYEYKQINTKYLGVSRRATLLPSLKGKDFESFDRIFRQYIQISIGDFLYSIGFDKNEIEELLKETGISPDYLISHGIKDDKLYGLISDKRFIDLYEEKRKEQKNYFKDYLKKVNEYSLDSLYIVDIGWKGTIQDNIFECLEEKTKIYGYYFGLYKCQYSDMNVKKGLMFQEIPKSSRYNIYSYNSIELERVFAADHGQVLKYMKDMDEIIPIYSEDRNDVEIYNYVHEWQETMNDSYERLVKVFSNSLVEIESMEKYLTDRYLFYLCTVFPKQRNIYLKFRKIAKENFGNISGKKIKTDGSFKREKYKKKKYLYVDYSYRLLDKYHLNFFEPFATLYCRIVYEIKRLWI